MFNSLVYINVTQQYCPRLLCRSVYLALTPLSTCRRGAGLGISTSVQQFLLASFPYIHNVCMYIHWLRLFVVFQEIQCLLNFHYDVGRQGIEIYPCIKFCLSQCFPLSVTSVYKENASSFFNQLLHCRYGLHYNVLLGLMTSV